MLNDSIINELERMWKRWLQLTSIYHPNIGLEGMRKTTTYFTTTNNNFYPDRCLNQEHPGYKDRVVPVLDALIRLTKHRELRDL